MLRTLRRRQRRATIAADDSSLQRLICGTKGGTRDCGHGTSACRHVRRLTGCKRTPHGKVRTRTERELACPVQRSECIRAEPTAQSHGGTSLRTRPERTRPLNGGSTALERDRVLGRGIANCDRRRMHGVCPPIELEQAPGVSPCLVCYREHILQLRAPPRVARSRLVFYQFR